MMTGNKSGGVYWVFIALACVIRGALLTPNIDDGIYFYQIYNTVGWYNPFFNDYYGQYFHFMKPLTVLYALVYSLTTATSFRIIALIQSAELFACVGMFYCCARRYASKEASQAGALLFLYFLFIHGYIAPTRPETTVLLCALTIFWLGERFSDTHRVRYLIVCSVLVFLVAIPMHTNGSIPLIYLALFTAAQRKHLSRRAALALALCSIGCALAGGAMLVYPHVSSLAQSLALFSYDGERFSMVIGEYVRIKDFVGNHHHFPLSMLLIFACCGGLLCGFGELRRSGLRTYRAVLLYGLAAFLGLGILPSAAWTVYVVYYFLPLMVGFSLALDFCARRTGSYHLQRLVFILPGVLVLWYGYGIMPRLYFLFYALPFFLAAILIRRMTTVQTLGIVVVPMLVYSMLMMGSSKIIYDRADRRIQECGGLVLAHPLFNFSGENVLQVVPLDVNSDERGYTVEIIPVARAKADLINAHLLTRLLGPASVPPRKSRWVARRGLGQGFHLLSNDEWGMPEHIAGQVQPLGYSVVKETPLSGKLLDGFANPSMKHLRCIEYRYAGPTPWPPDLRGMGRGEAGGSPAP